VMRGDIFIKIAPVTFNPAFFRDAVCVHGLDSYRWSPVGDIVTRFANGAIRKSRYRFWVWSRSKLLKGA
jgi:hypothetical protein